MELFKKVISSYLSIVFKSMANPFSLVAAQRKQSMKNLQMMTI